MNSGGKKPSLTCVWIWIFDFLWAMNWPVMQALDAAFAHYEADLQKRMSKSSNPNGRV